MPSEFYPADILKRSRQLYESIKDWATQRKDVTLIGGWAVYELVDPLQAQQSRDVDLVLHTEEALAAFDRRLEDWNLKWRQAGRRYYKECVVRNTQSNDDTEILVDVFTTDPEIGAAKFGMHKNRNVKPVPAQGFLPPLESLLHDKILTVPVRSDRDVEGKRAKDLLDVYHLVFHNREGKLPIDLLAKVPATERQAAAQFIPNAIKFNSKDKEKLEDVRRWLLK